MSNTLQNAGAQPPIDPDAPWEGDWEDHWAPIRTIFGE